MSIIDVSIMIKNKMISYPGDPEPIVKKAYSIEKGDSANVSSINLSSHTGTHIDAPSHFIEGATSIDKLPIDLFVGIVKIFDFGDIDVITRADLENKDIKKGDRIFFKTKNSKYLELDEFYKGFTYLSSDGAEYLSQVGVELIGIDYLSIEEFGSKDNIVHKLLLQNGIVIIEGLDLRLVEEGEYEYIALPLRIEGCDAAPARVILKK